MQTGPSAWTLQNKPPGVMKYNERHVLLFFSKSALKYKITRTAGGQNKPKEASVTKENKDKQQDVTT